MKDSKNLVIGMLCAVLCIMAVAYAAFTTTLNINGSANISSNWSVIIPASDGISCTTQAAAGGSEEGLSASGTGTFIPQNPEIIVGTAKNIVIEVKNFITPLRLFEIIEP